MKIAVIGAGFAGLAAGKTFAQFGHDVTIYEKAPDVGGERVYVLIRMVSVAKLTLLSPTPERPVAPAMRMPAARS